MCVSQKQTNTQQFSYTTNMHRSNVLVVAFLLCTLLSVASCKRATRVKFINRSNHLVRAVPRWRQEDLHRDDVVFLPTNATFYVDGDKVCVCLHKRDVSPSVAHAQRGYLQEDVTFVVQRWCVGSTVDTIGDGYANVANIAVRARTPK